MEALKKCSNEYNSPGGLGATFLTNPEMTSHNSKCFTMCLLYQYNLIDKQGNFQVQSMQPFLNSLPQSRFRTSIEQNLNFCLQENSAETCDKGYKFVQCFYRRAATPLNEPGQRTYKPRK
ncbi:uncharacterized protein LOC124357323 isoform X2 [Homalodisca vitripennis]|nr:uncharacterized protein LOC124357323 isoform X2 [Homalodisca vitripennis]